MELKLNKRVARNSAVDAFDVKQIKKALNRLCLYYPPEKLGITGIPDVETFDALKQFQKIHELPATGTIKPGDETERMLKQEAAKTPDGSYIWRTVEDDKVRGGHVALNRTTRLWSDAPDPGEDFNCRCWAEALPYDPPIEPVYPELLLIPALRTSKNIADIIRSVFERVSIQKKHDKQLTVHGQARTGQRNISPEIIIKVIEKAKKLGQVTTKTGKYGTPQYHYEADGIIVIVETQGRNAGKVITTWYKQ